MRGFLVLFDTEPKAPREQPDPLEKQLDTWEKTFPAARLKRLDCPHCRVYLYSERDRGLPVEFNQRLERLQDGLVLWVGPRVDMTDPRLFVAPSSNNLELGSPSFRRTGRVSP